MSLHQHNTSNPNQTSGLVKELDKLGRQRGSSATPRPANDTPTSPNSQQTVSQHHFMMNIIEENQSYGNSVTSATPSDRSASMSNKEPQKVDAHSNIPPTTQSLRPSREYGGSRNGTFFKTASSHRVNSFGQLVSTINNVWAVSSNNLVSVQPDVRLLHFFSATSCKASR